MHHSRFAKLAPTAAVIVAFLPELNWTDCNMSYRRVIAIPFMRVQNAWTVASSYQALALLLRLCSTTNYSVAVYNKIRLFSVYNLTFIGALRSHFHCTDSITSSL